MGFRFDYKICSTSRRLSKQKKEKKSIKTNKPTILNHQYLSLRLYGYLHKCGQLL